jgi:hypothetical protein
VGDAAWLDCPKWFRDGTGADRNRGKEAIVLNFPGGKRSQTEWILYWKLRCLPRPLC